MPHLLENPSPHTLYMREWRQRNREKTRQRNRNYIATPEGAAKNRKRALDWYYANLEKGRERSRVWGQNNSERKKENVSVWCKDNPEAYKAIWRNRNARVRGADGKCTLPDIMRIFDQQKGKCAYFRVCKTKLGNDYEVDHIVPLARGGTHWPSNIQLTCLHCNRRKRASDPVEYAQRLGMLL